MMGCFFGCFRFKPNDRAIDDVICPKTSYSRSRGGFNLVRQESDTSKKNQLSSMFLCEDGESPRDTGSGLSSIDRELKNEAKFLKACGALMETPDEIRKTSQNETFKKINWNEQTDPTLLSSLLNSDKSKRYASEETKSRSKHTNSLSFLLSDPSSVVQVEGDKNNPGAQSPLDSSPCNVSTPQIGYQRQLAESRQSPYPTPIKLIDEMETPCTVYPSNQEKIGRCKPSQFVYPVLNRGDDTSKCKSKTDLSCQPGHLQPEEFSSPNRNSSLAVAPYSRGKGEENLTPTGSLPSLSQWLKPPLPEEERRKIREAFLKESSPFGKSSDVDRPIIGIVAAHWNDEEPTRISPKKWFDGNGIPNLTNKYKEDQKVSWHATPFEERLEKALSDDTQLLGRKLKATMIQFDEECEESDTAASQGNILSGST